MADVTVESQALTNHNISTLRCGPVWTDKDTGYIVYQDLGQDLVYRKTTDGGATWGDPVDIDVGTVGPYDVWFDKWTPGDSGTLIHIWWTETGDDDVHYRTLDTSDDTLGTDTQVVSSTGFVAPGTRSAAVLSGTKAVGGNLYVQWWGNATGARGFSRSIDDGVNWTARTDGADGDLVDEVMLLPDDDSADNEDVVMIYWDRSADELSIKKYDNSANSWAETSISTGMTDNTTILQLSAVIRHSDGHIIVAAWNDLDLSTSDLKVWDIDVATPTITSKVDVVTNATDCFGVGLFIDQGTDDLYCGYLGNEDGSETLGATVTAFFKKITAADFSADNAWGSQQTYGEASADDLRYISGGESTPGDAEGRFEPLWFNDDTNGLHVNKINSVELGVVAGGAIASKRMLLKLGI